MSAFAGTVLVTLVAAVVVAVAAAALVPVHGWWSCRRGARHRCAGENSGGRCTHIAAAQLTGPVS